MEAQKPAEGISLVKDFGDSKHYRVDCTCGNEDDAIWLWLALEEDMQELRVEFDVAHRTEWWKRLAEWETYKIKNSWLYAIVNTAQELINGIHHRLVITKDVWIHGYVKYHSSTYMTKQQALNFSQLLIDAIKEIEEYKNNK